MARYSAPPTDKATVGGIPSIAKLEDDVQELLRLVEGLPDQMLEWARVDKAHADDKAHQYLLREIEPRVRSVTYNRVNSLALLILREEAYWPVLYERESHGYCMRAYLAEDLLQSYGEAIALLSERGAEVAPVIRGAGKEPTTLSIPATVGVAL